MENASKAIIISGTILIAILLIAIAMMIYNSSSGVLNSAASKMSAQEKTIFNKQWTNYEGEQTGSVIAQLAASVERNNAKDDIPKVTVNIAGSGFLETGIVSALKDIPGYKTKIFNVKCEMGNAGVVEGINITQ